MDRSAGAGLGAGPALVALDGFAVIGGPLGQRGPGRLPEGLEHRRRTAGRSEAVGV